MKSRPTDDEIIARGDIWTGEILALRKRIADFTVDGVRFGTLVPETKSGSPHDRRLARRSEEMVTAVFILARLGYEHVAIRTIDENGKPLDRPDLDAHLLSGDVIGIEVAQASPTARMKHDAQIAEIEHSVRDLIDNDASFREAFGLHYLTLSTSSVLGEREIATKKQMAALKREVVAFIRSGGHRREASLDEVDGCFTEAYPTLRNRGATYYSSPAWYGPYFSVMDGGTVNRDAEIGEVIRTLNKHRRQAQTYRTRRTWMLMYLPDSNEIFRNTAASVRELGPDIAPFEVCHVADACGRLETMKQSAHAA